MESLSKQIARAIFIRAQQIRNLEQAAREAADSTGLPLSQCKAAYMDYLYEVRAELSK